MNKFKDWILSKIISEINKELSKQNKEIYLLLNEEFSIAREQRLNNTNKIVEISKQLDVVGRMLRSKGFN